MEEYLDSSSTTALLYIWRLIYQKQVDLIITRTRISVMKQLSIFYGKNFKFIEWWISFTLIVSGSFVFRSNDNYEMLDFALSVKNVSMHCVVETFFKISTTLLSIGKDMQLFISFWQMSIQIQDGNRNSFNKLKYII